MSGELQGWDVCHNSKKGPGWKEGGTQGGSRLSGGLGFWITWFLPFLGPIVSIFGPV